MHSFDPPTLFRDPEWEEHVVHILENSGAASSDYWGKLQYKLYSIQREAQIRCQTLKEREGSMRVFRCAVKLYNKIGGSTCPEITKLSWDLVSSLDGYIRGALKESDVIRTLFFVSDMLSRHSVTCEGGSSPPNRTPS